MKHKNDKHPANYVQTWRSSDDFIDLSITNWGIYVEMWFSVLTKMRN